MRSWWPHSLRAQLTAWQVCAMVVVLGLYVGLVLWLVTRNLSGTIDSRLRSDFRWAAEMAQQGPDGSLSWFEGDPWGTDSPWLQVFSGDGELIYRTAMAQRLPVSDSEQLSRSAVGRIVAVPSDPAPFRLLTDRATVGGRPVVLQVGRSEATMRLEVREMALLLGLGLPLAVALAGGVGYVVARRALAPVARMGERARDITASRLDERLPIDTPKDELGRMAAVFNDTLGRLESSFLQMRRFTGNVSHELRTPLTAIRSVGEVGLRGPSDAAAYREVIESMLEETDRLTRLVNQLLAVARADGGDVTPGMTEVNLGSLAEEVATDLGVLAEEKGQTLDVDVNASPPCLADHITTRQAVSNLVDNAIRYTPEGGRILLRVYETRSNVCLEVTDTGPGIPERDRARLFERLFRSRENAADPGGSGLGLSIAKWAVEANHGELTYQPVAAGGSCFRIQLPRQDILSGSG